MLDVVLSKTRKKRGNKRLELCRTTSAKGGA
jgi:hypothetical protein